MTERMVEHKLQIFCRSIFKGPFKTKKFSMLWVYFDMMIARWQFESREMISLTQNFWYTVDSRLFEPPQGIEI